MQITEKQLKTMLDLQNSMNGRVNRGWREEGFNWVDAIWTEAAEAFNHTYWEWWKNQGKEPNIPQIKLELVDIWHFLLSELMQHEEVEGMTYFAVLSHVCKEVDDSRAASGDTSDINTPEKLRFFLKVLIMAALMPPSENRIVELLAAFVVSLQAAGMSWEELYKLYIGKNTLNRFRQDNGYKTQTAKYKSVWAITEGKEDNDYLTEILEGMSIESEDFISDVYALLKTQYEENNVVYYSTLKETEVAV